MTALRTQQIQVLKSEYQKNKILTADKIKEIAQKLELEESDVTSFFSRELQKEQMVQNKEQERAETREDGDFKPCFTSSKKVTVDKAQDEVLIAEFNKDNALSSKRKEELAERLKMKEEDVKYLFHINRIKMKKDLERKGKDTQAAASKDAATGAKAAKKTKSKEQQPADADKGGDKGDDGKPSKKGKKKSKKGKEAAPSAARESVAKEKPAQKPAEKPAEKLPVPSSAPSKPKKGQEPAKEDGEFKPSFTVSKKVAVDKAQEEILIAEFNKDDAMPPKRKEELAEKLKMNGEHIVYLFGLNRKKKKNQKAAGTLQSAADAAAGAKAAEGKKKKEKNGASGADKANLSTDKPSKNQKSRDGEEASKEVVVITGKAAEVEKGQQAIVDGGEEVNDPKSPKKAAKRKRRKGEKEASTAAANEQQPPDVEKSDNANDNFAVTWWKDGDKVDATPSKRSKKKSKKAKDTEETSEKAAKGKAELDKGGDKGDDGKPSKKGKKKSKKGKEAAPSAAPESVAKEKAAEKPAEKLPVPSTAPSKPKKGQEPAKEDGEFKPSFTVSKKVAVDKAQEEILIAEFNKDDAMPRKRKEELAEKLKMNGEHIVYLFGLNRLNRERKKKKNQKAAGTLQSAADAAAGAKAAEGKKKKEKNGASGADKGNVSTDKPSKNQKRKDRKEEEVQKASQEASGKKPKPAKPAKGKEQEATVAGKVAETTTLIEKPSKKKPKRAVSEKVKSPPAITSNALQKKTTYAFECSHVCATDEFFQGAKWSPCGLFLLSNYSNSMCIFDIPFQTLKGPCDYPVTLDTLKVKSQIGSPVYDYAWYPRMQIHNLRQTGCYAVTSKSSPVHLNDVLTGATRCSYKAHDSADELTSAYSLAFDPKGEHLACGYKNSVALFNICRPGKDPVGIYDLTSNGQKGIISSIDYNQQQTLVACGAYDGSLGLYDAGFRSVGFVPKGHHTGGVTQVMFSRCGFYLYSGARKCGSIHCWDIRFTKQKPVYSLQRPLVQGTNQKIEFDIEPLGRHLFTGNGGNVLCYDLVDGSEVANFKVADDAINGLSINSLWPVIATASGERRYPSFSDDEDEGGKAKEKESKEYNCMKLWKPGTPYPLLPCPGVEDKSSQSTL